MQTEKKLNLTSAAVSDRGLSEKRPQNEDSFLELATLGLFAVADGVGGAQAGDVASQMAVEILAEAFNNQPLNSDAEQVMKIALERANGAIFQMAADLPQLASMATTVVALQVSGDVATIGHVGDSRLYRIDPRGTLNRETADHSVVEEEVRAGRMTAEQALNHPSRNIISRALGAEDSVEVELKTMLVEPGTTFLLCSDGITRHIPDRELEELLGLYDDPRAVTQRLKEICYERGAEDNLTAVVVQVPRTTGFIHNDEEMLASADLLEVEDLEQDTIATARPPQDQTEDGETFEDLAVPEDEEKLDDESYLSDELSAGNSSADGTGPGEYTSSTIELPAAPAIAPRHVLPEPELAFVRPANTGGSSFSRIISSVALILLGAVLGAGAYYLFVPPPPVPEAPPVMVEKSPDISLTAFEESRRLIDRDPAAFITANAASPQVPEDYFLMGRAFLLTGKNWEAKRAFMEARNRMAQADPKNSKTLAAEIAMALALIETPGAAEAFAREIAAANTANANVNAAANAVPVR
ncbi:MAG: protein phosphatase 2C domain-containing protein [Acidobacteriota bacterium]